MSELPQVLQDARRTGKVSLTLPDGVVTDAWRQNDAQLVGVAHLLQVPRMLLADPTGVGKTPMALIAWAILRHLKGWPGLVLTTQSNLSPWVEKANLFVNTPDARVYHGQGRTEVLTGDPGLLVTTYHTAAADADILTDFFKGSPPIAIFDEAHYLKGFNQEVLRPRLQDLTNGSRYVWGTTATVTSGRYDELAAILDFIVPGFCGGRAGFERDYVPKVLITLPGKRIPGGGRSRGKRFYRKPTKDHHYKNIPVLLERAAPYVLRRPIDAFKEVLPDIDWREEWSDMEPNHRALYQTILDKILPATPDRAERLLVDIAAHTYAQVACDAPAVLGFTDLGLPAKCKDLLRLLKGELRDEKTVVYCKYAKVVNWLAEVLKSKGVKVFGTITGAVSQRRRDTVRDGFSRSHGGGVLLISNAGSEALDLQAARAVVCYDLPWGTLELTQVIGRVRRIGSSHSTVSVYLLGHESSTDRTDLTRLKNKSKITLKIDKTLTATVVSTPVAPVSTIESETIREKGTAGDEVEQRMSKRQPMFRETPSLYPSPKGDCNYDQVLGEILKTQEPAPPLSLKDPVWSR